MSMRIWLLCRDLTAAARYVAWTIARLRRNDPASYGQTITSSSSAR
jgi:hypothetical protein